MIQILKAIPFFAELSDSDLEAIGAATVMHYFPVGHVIFKEGDPGEMMFIIKNGTVTVIQQNEIIAELKEGDFFGEMALVSEAPRNATIQCKTDVELLMLNKTDFKDLLSTHPGIASKVSYEMIHRVKENDRRK